MTGPRLHPSDQAALDGLLSVDPVWAGLTSARDALGLAEGTILHAGPPCSDAGPCKPILNSAAMAALYEGWAKTEEDALKLVGSSDVTLLPAQDHHAVVPLASVLTSTMAVQVVEDRNNPDNRTFGPINGGSGPALRLGMAGAPVVDHLRWLNGDLADYLTTAAGTRIGLIDIADQALTLGDDCHGRTIAASKLLVERIADVAGIAPPSVSAFFEAGPSFFLNLWMAASKCVLAGADGRTDSSAVVAIGGNGRDMGLKLSGMPGTWFTVRAAPPAGKLEPGNTDKDRLGAIGDSAVVDAVGLGAMAMHFAPAQKAALGPYMETPSDALAQEVLAAVHDGFSRTRPRTGLIARRVVEAGQSIAISLGILDREGVRGRIGGGISVPPTALFAEGCDALDTDNAETQSGRSARGDHA